MSFRIDERTLELLETAAARFKLSAHSYARRLVEDALSDTEAEWIREEMRAIRGDVTTLRDDIAASLEMVLLNLTSASEDNIRAWVTNNLRRSGTHPKDG